MNDPTARAVRNLVDDYLQLCEDRNLEQASASLAPGVRLVFPGSRVFGSLTDMVQAADGAYRWVRKRRERYFVGQDGDATTVTSLGTLYGENLDGTPFDAIRYADVFVIRNGKIEEQHVYNDMALRTLRT